MNLSRKVALKKKKVFILSISALLTDAKLGHALLLSSLIFPKKFIYNNSPVAQALSWDNLTHVAHTSERRKWIIWNLVYKPVTILKYLFYTFLISWHIFHIKKFLVNIIFLSFFQTSNYYFLFITFASSSTLS